MALWVPPMPWPPWNRESTIWRPRAMSCWSSDMSWSASMPLQRPFWLALPPRRATTCAGQGKQRGRLGQGPRVGAPRRHPRADQAPLQHHWPLPSLGQAQTVAQLPLCPAELLGDHAGAATREHEGVAPCCASPCRALELRRCSQASGFSAAHLHTGGALGLLGLPGRHPGASEAADKGAGRQGAQAVKPGAAGVQESRGGSGRAGWWSSGGSAPMPCAPGRLQGLRGHHPCKFWSSREEVNHKLVRRQEPGRAMVSFRERAH